MRGEAKESAEIDSEKEIVDISVVQTMGKDKFGSITQSGLQEALDKNAGEEKTKATSNGENFIVEFIESNRFYEVDSDGNVKKLDIVKDKSPGDITKDKDGNPLDGSPEHPYEIWCIEDLVSFSQSVNNGNTYNGLYINLMTTLDFESNYSYSDYTTKDYDVYLGGDGTTELKTQLSSNGNGFIGIGDAHLGKSFFGTFDGKENKIVNLYENTKGALFGRIQNSTIKNLKVYGTIVRDSQCAGIIIGAENSYIINCANYADIYGKDVAGVCYDSRSSYFYNCYNMGTVSGKWQSAAGGIVGMARSGTIICNSYNLGNISLDDGNSYAGAGGIVGYVESGKVIIENCYNTGNVTSSKYQGGIIGNKQQMEATLNNCFFLNNINSGIGDSTGGISVSAEQLKNNEKIEGKYIIDIFNDFAKEYNEKENSLKLNYWKIDQNSTYPVFEE